MPDAHSKEMGSQGENSKRHGVEIPLLHKITNVLSHSGIPHTNVQTVAIVFFISFYYIHTYPAHEYTFPQHPIPAPQTHGNNSAPRDDLPTIPEGGEILSLRSCSKLL